MKKLIYLLIFLMLTPLVTAGFADTLLSNNGTVNNGVCEGNELPFDNDCRVTEENVLNGEILGHPWFLRVLILIGLLLLFSRNSNIDKDAVLIIALVILAVIIIPIPEVQEKEVEVNQTITECEDAYDPVCFGSQTYDNLCLAEEANATTMEECIPIYEVRESKIEEFWNSLVSLGNSVSPRFPVAGWLVILVLIFILFGFVTKGAEFRDNFFDNIFGGGRRK